MRANLIILLAGGLFGIGLATSGMTDPGRVVGFLDVSGDWDPTLAFVMGGALLVFGLGYKLLRKRLELPEARERSDFKTPDPRGDYFWYRMGAKRILSGTRHCQSWQTID